MTDYSSTSTDDHRDTFISELHCSYPHPISLHDNMSSLSSLHPNGNMRVGKSIGSSTPVGELPPLVGVPHDKPGNHPTTPDSSGIPLVCRGAIDGENPVSPSTPSPLIRRRLKYMVRQCSDSELLKNNQSLGRLKLAPASGTVSPVPHPPDKSPRSLNSSESISPRIHCKPQTNSTRSGPSIARISRSLEGSPMAVRRVQSGANPSPSSKLTSDQHRPRPFSFGSYSDVCALSGNEPSQMQSTSTKPSGSPFVSRRTVGVRLGSVVAPSSSSRPDTPANDVISIYDSKKSHHISSSSGDRSEVQENEKTSPILPEEYVDHEESVLPKRRLRRDSGSQHSTGPVLSDNNRNFKKSHQVAASTGTSDYPYPYEDHVVNHLVDDDTGYPSNLYDIQERRESILSLEAVQEIARRFANNGESSPSEPGNNENDNKDYKTEKNRIPGRKPTPEYRKEPLSADKRVSNWLKGIQDPTERAPTTLERILPDIL